jgi:hypothetical protein
MPVHPLCRGDSRELLDLGDGVYHRETRTVLPRRYGGVGHLKLARENGTVPAFRGLAQAPLAKRILFLPNRYRVSPGFATLRHGDLGSKPAPWSSFRRLFALRRPPEAV